MPTVAGILHGRVATGDGLGDGVGLAAADGLGEVDDVVLVLAHAHSTTSATSPHKRMRGNIAVQRCVFAYSRRGRRAEPGPAGLLGWRSLVERRFVRWGVAGGWIGMASRPAARISSPILPPAPARPQRHDPWPPDPGPLTCL